MTKRLEKYFIKVWVILNKDREIVNIFMSKSAADRYQKNYMKTWGAKKGLVIEEHEVAKDNVDHIYLGTACMNIAYNDRLYYDPVEREVYCKPETPIVYEEEWWKQTHKTQQANREDHNF